MAGPGCGICRECASLAASVLVTGRDAATTSTAIVTITPGPGRPGCSFCAKPYHQTAGRAAAGESRICGECAGLCEEIFTGEPG